MRHQVYHGSIADAKVDELLIGRKVDIVYADPPWGDAHMKYWATMNQKQTGQIAAQLSHQEFYDRLFQLIHRHVVGWIFIETGLRWADWLMTQMKLNGCIVGCAYTVKYQSGAQLKDSALIACSYQIPETPLRLAPEGLRGAALPAYCVSRVATPEGLVFDPCCGMGYTARAAVMAGMRFVGVELNAARLAKTQAFLSLSA